MENETLQSSRGVTIHIDPSFHAAMKTLAKQRKVLISNLYESAVEQYLESQNNHKKAVKKVLTSSVPMRN